MTRRAIVLVVALLVPACGGEIATIDPAGGSSTPAPPTEKSGGSGSGSSSGSGSGSGSEESEPVDPPTPRPNVDETKLPAAARFNLSYAVLGAAIGDEDECAAATHFFDVNLALGEVSAKLCVKNAAGDLVFETKTKSLGAAELASVQSELDALRVVPMPSQCLWDGPAYGITIGGQSFIDDDYNCRHRTDVGYVTRLYKLEQALKQVFTP